MKSLAFVLAAALSFANAGPAYKFPLQRRAPSAAGLSFSAKTPTTSLTKGNVSLGNSNFNDIFYATNITVCGQDISVDLDTGSTDLWVKPVTPLKGVETTKLNTSIVYGSGDVNGSIAVCPVFLGPYYVAKQAFISATTTHGMDDTFELGVYGLLGLGFDTDYSASIRHSVHSSDPKATWGGSVLTNLFYANPETPNFLAFLFDRASDLDEVSRGSFTIGETEDQYASIMNQPALPVFPDADVQRWNVVLDSLSVNGVSINLKSAVKGAPTGKAIALLDTGTSLSLGPPEAVKIIYSTIPGSAYSNSEKLWLVPCQSIANVLFSFGATEVPVHPLDMNLIDQVDEYTICAGGIQELGQSKGPSDVDWVLGDTFLRNVYSMFDFGVLDPPTGGLVGHPFVKLLPLPASEPTSANAEFKTARSAALAKLPPAVDPVTYVKDDAKSSSKSSSNPPSGNLAVANEPDAATLTALQSDMSKIVSYLPVVLGLLGANALIVLLLLIVGCIFFFKRKGGGRGRTYQPVTH